MLDELAPSDVNSANNARAWTFGTRNPALTPSRRFAQLEYVLGPMESPTPGYVYKNNVRIDVFNTGLDNLVMGTPVLVGPNAPLCRIFNNQTTNAPIAPTEFKSLTVETGMTNRGMHRATLQLPSNDPEHPVVTVDLLSILYNAGQDVDTDGDGVYDFIETGMGTSTNLADTDGDGLSDGAEDVNRNGVVDEGETAARVADTDGDGAADGVEDLNHNGIWDYGESAALVGDTDGDGMLDGQEGRAGTHPFDPESVFAVDDVWHVSGGSGHVVRWHSAAGKYYRLTRSTNLLTDAFAVAIATNIPAMPPLNTFTDTTASGASPHYYRIELESGPTPATP